MIMQVILAENCSGIAYQLPYAIPDMDYIYRPSSCIFGTRTEPRPTRRDKRRLFGRGGEARAERVRCLGPALAAAEAVPEVQLSGPRRKKAGRQ